MAVFERKIVDSDLVYPHQQYSYDASDNIEYIGYNTNLSASDGDMTWIVKRFYWTGSDLVRKKTRVNITWTDRATGW